MSVPLVLAGLAMGLASSPHCAAMCAAPCGALVGGCGRRAAAFHVGRVFGYAGAGAVAAAGVGWLGAAGAAAPALRPLWTLLHLGFLVIGLWWLCRGEHPAWLMRRVSGVVPVTFVGRSSSAPWRPGLMGLAWIAWPCAVLQGALLLSSLGGTPVAGAMVMVGFALGSLPAVAAAPWAWAKWRAWTGRAQAPRLSRPLGFRLAGAVMTVSSGWALAHGVGMRIAELCGI